MDTTTIEGRIPKAISCGGYFTLILMTDDTIWGTGDNNNGQLGIAIGDTTDREILTQMDTTTTIEERIPKAIYCGLYFTLILMTDDTIWGTGENNKGQLGIAIGDTTDRKILTQMDTTTTIEGRIPKAISCGDKFTLILMTDGTIWGTGLNTNKEILTQMDTTTIEERIPKSISCTQYNRYVLMTDGTIWGQGSNLAGQLGIAIGDTTERNILTQMGENNNNIEYILGMTEDELIGNICFPAGTPVLTDQGLIAIDKIDIKINTLNQKRIVDITKTVSKETFLVSFEKDALGIDMPSQETIISPGHTLLYEGLMHPAKWFLEKFPGVKSIPYTGEPLYNVLLEKHDTMNVNNLICETLLPDNPIAKFYTKQCKLSQENRDIMVNILKGCLERDDIATYNQILKCC